MGNIEADTAKGAEITNTRRLGNLTVSKSVVSAVYSDDQHEFKFTVHIEGDVKIDDNTYGSDSDAMNKTLTNAIPDDDGDIFYFDVKLLGESDEKLQPDVNAPIRLNSADGAAVPTTVGNGVRPLWYDASSGIIHNVPVTWHKAVVDAETGQVTPAGGQTVLYGIPVNTRCSVTEATNIGSGENKVYFWSPPADRASMNPTYIDRAKNTEGDLASGDKEVTTANLFGNTLCFLFKAGARYPRTPGDRRSHIPRGSRRAAPCRGD